LSKFCEDCGAALTPSGTRAGNASQQQSEVHFAAGAGDSAGALDGERKTVTALFADIKGSMELMEDLDPEEARAIVDPALKLMIDAARRYDGYVVQSTGDGIFALFGAPLAFEDHPQRALYAALRMQEDLRRYSAKLVTDGGTPIQCRVGVNTGEVVVRPIATGEGHTEYTPIGHTANLASRMQAVAPVGSIAAAEATRKLCEGYFIFKALGPARVKGVSEPVNVCEVTGLGPLRTKLQRAAARGLTRFVGREHEMQTLRHAAARAQAGHGQIVAVMADPGVGKSRLFYEFKATSQSGWMVLEAYSVSHGKASAYLPVLELLSAYFEISCDDDERKRRERILGKVLGLDRTLEDALPHLYSLHGVAEADDSLAQMEPQVRRRRTLEAIKRIMLRESLNQPLMVIFEDLHWIDAETQALLNLLVDTIANARILLLMNYRPEYRHEWGSRTHYTQLRLDPLGKDSAQQMLAALVGEEKDLMPLKRLIIERTEGTPFFVEEMVQALFEQGALARNGTVKLARPLIEIKVPPTVQAVLASRIDRLQPNEKDLLQTLAVLGREFALNLVAQVWQHPQAPELQETLAQLQVGEFIFEQPPAGEVEYIFKHALTQEVAYNSILAGRRRVLHGQTALAIETLHPEQLADHYSDLAYHYLHSNDTANALRYTQLAAEQAMSRAAYPQATSLIGAALKMVDKLPEGTEHNRAELALLTVESTAALILHGPSSKERERTVRRMVELAEKIGERDELVRALCTLGGFYFTQGESVRALELARRCLVLGERVQDEGLSADLFFTTGMVAWRCGNFQESASYYEAALRKASRGDRRVSPQWGGLYESVIPSFLSQDLLLLGRVSESIKSADQGLKQARHSKHMFSLGVTLVFGWGHLYLDCRRPDLVVGLCEEVVALSEENGFAQWPPFGQFIHGWALFELGRVTEGVAEMDSGITGFRRLGGVPRMQYFIALRAEAIARIGRVDEALTILNATLAHVERSGEKADYAEMLRLKGETLLLHDGSATAEAEKCFREALAVARAQEAKWWELRAAVSLARLLRDTNRRDEARSMLTEIYNWFSDGLDLPDLKEANALLGQLAS
jgi:class 3 adenylate cyclase/tetratricopeptide (TPR) repeat protein